MIHFMYHFIIDSFLTGQLEPTNDSQRQWLHSSVGFMGPVKCPVYKMLFKVLLVFFYPADYGTIYGPGTSTRQAIDHQDFTCASPGASESSGSYQSLSPGAGTQDDSRANSKRWDSAEVKILVAAHKAYNNALKSAKSSRGKKAIWEKIYAQFKQACDDTSIRSEKNLAQAKEKWHALFEKYNLFAIVIQELDEAENPLNFTKSWTNSWAAQTK